VVVRGSNPHFSYKILDKTHTRARSGSERRGKNSRYRYIRKGRSTDGKVKNVDRSHSARASETLKRVFEKTGKHSLRGVPVAFTAVGEHELGDFHMHELLGNPQKFRSAHFEGAIDAVG
jgi:hypothetical protein